MEELLELKEQRKALVKNIDEAKTREELDKVEVDLRKLDIKIRDIEEEARSSYDEPAARTNAVNNGTVVDSRSFNPMSAYAGQQTQGNDKNFKVIASYRTAEATQIAEIKNISDNTMGSIALRSGEKLLDKIKVPEEQRNLDLGKYIKGMVTGDWEGANAEQRAMMTTATGVLIPQVLSAQVIDIARNKSLFTLANVPYIPMKTNNMKISKVKNDPTFKFKEEGKEATESSFELESVDLKSKTAYGYAYVSIEAVKSSQNLSHIIINVFSQAIAEAIDQAMLYGQYNGTSFDSFAPSGIMNDSDIKTIAAKPGAGYDDIIKAIGRVRGANGNPTVLGMNAETEELFSLLKTTDGQYLTPPKAVTDLNKIVSNQLKYDVAAGSDAIVFDPSSMVIGMQESISIKMFDNTDECVKKGLIGFRVMAMLDCIVTQPSNICKVEGIKAL